MKKRSTRAIFALAVTSVGMVCVFALLSVLKDGGGAGDVSRPSQLGRTASSNELGLSEQQVVSAESFSDFDAGNFSEIAKTLMASDPPPDPKIVNSFFQAWLKVDPLSATKAALEFPARFRLNESKEFSLSYNRLLQSDPDVAIEMLIASNGRLGSFLLYQGHHRRLQDPTLEALNKAPNFDLLQMTKEEFSEKVGGIENSDAARKLIGDYAKYLAGTSSFGELIDWAESMNGGNRNAALGTLFFSSGSRAEVLDYLISAEPEVMNAVGVNYVVATSETDPVSSIEWLSDHAGVFSVNPNFSVLSTWILNEPEAAKNYVRSIDNPQRRELAGTAVAQALAKNSVEDSLDWVKSWTGDRRGMLGATLSFAIQFGSKDVIDYLNDETDQEFATEIKRAVHERIPKEIGRNRELLQEVLVKF